AMAVQLERPGRAVFNLHPPPYATQLDDAPALDDELRVQATLGQIQYRAVGSTAVKDIEPQYQPLLGLHGHIHESSGIRRVGPRKSMVINPGSDYSTGALNGALITLNRDKAGAQLVRGQLMTGPSTPGALVAIDIGTSGARASAFDLAGDPLGEVRRSYPTELPGEGRAEQDAGRWRSAALSALTALVGQLGPGV